MNRLLIIVIFNFLGLTCYTQTALAIKENEITVGMNYLTNEVIKAKEHTVPEPIYEYYFDTISKTLMLQLRGPKKNGKKSGIYQCLPKSVFKSFLYQLQNTTNR